MDDPANAASDSEWMKIQDGPPVSYDVAATIHSWRRVDIDNVVRILRIMRGLVSKNEEAVATEEALVQGGLLFDTRCCPTHTSQERHLRFKTFRVTNLPIGGIPAELRTLREEAFDGVHENIDLISCWADHEIAGHFFTLPDNMFSKDGGVFVFTFPRKILEELGTIDPMSGKILLFPETRVLPVVPNLFRLFAVIHPGYPNEAFASGLYRFYMKQTKPVKDASCRLYLNFQIYVNLPILREHLNTGKQIPGRLALTGSIAAEVDRAQNHQTYAGADLIERLRNLLVHPPACPPVFQQGLTEFLTNNKSDLVPYPYQFANLNWMNTIETEIDEGIWAAKGHARMERSDVVPLHGDLGFNLEKRIFVKMPSSHTEARTPPRIAYELRGGALFDDAGLGKTVTCMLLACWRGPRLPRPDPTQPWSIFRDFGGTLVVCPSQVCSQYETEIKRVSPTSKILLIANKRHHQKLTYKDVIAADFVIVSDNFITNGSYRKPLLAYHATDRNEAYDIAKMELVFRQADEDKPAGIMNETFVFLHAIHWTRLILDEVHFHIHNRERLSFLEKIHAKYVWLSTGTPLSSTNAGPQFSFGGEALTYMRLLWKHDPIRIDFPSPHATANQDEMNDERRRRSQAATISKQGMFFKDMMQRDMFDDFWTNAVVRHTKASVESEIKLPPVVNHVIWCEFSSVERALYEHIASLYPNTFALLAEVCTNPHVNAQSVNLRVCSDLNQVRTLMTAGIQKELEEVVGLLGQQRSTVDYLKVRLSELGQSETDVPNALPSGPSGSIGTSGSSGPLASHTVTVPDEEDDDDMMDYELEDGELMETEEDGGGTVVSRNLTRPTSMTRMQRIFLEESRVLREMEEKHNKLTRSLAFFEAAVTLAPDEKCSICLEIIQSGNTEFKVGFTTCGHHFCFFCITSWIRANASCPVCRSTLNQGDALILNLAPAPVSEQPGQYEEERQRYGAKLAEMLRYLRDHPTEKIVVFSQFDDVLRKSSKTLKSLGIPFATCYGNFAQRQHGIHTFKTDPNCNLILLSTQFSSSGTNLTEASTVIFLDPIYRVDQRLRLETQALARVLRITQRNPVKFVKFLVRGTIEEEVWQRDYGQQQPARASS